MVPQHHTRQQPLELLHTKLIDRPRGDQASGLRPTFIADYHHTQARHDTVTLTRGAWNSGAHNGARFVQRTGSAAQRAALQRADHVTRTVHAARSSEREHLQLEGGSGACCATSCNLYWAEASVHRCHHTPPHLEQAAGQRA